jgi:hypothetical protein
MYNSMYFLETSVLFTIYQCIFQNFKTNLKKLKANFIKFQNFQKNSKFQKFPINSKFHEISKFSFKMVNENLNFLNFWKFYHFEWKFWNLMEFWIYWKFLKFWIFLKILALRWEMTEKSLLVLKKTSLITFYQCIFRNIRGMHDLSMYFLETSVLF